MPLRRIETPAIPVLIDAVRGRLRDYSLQGCNKDIVYRGQCDWRVDFGSAELDTGAGD
jgi:hypothetical protein